MKDYEEDSAGGSTAPWDTYREDIPKVVLEKGVTSIGNHAFEGCTSLTPVILRAMANHNNDLQPPLSATFIRPLQQRAVYSCLLWQS